MTLIQLVCRSSLRYSLRVPTPQSLLPLHRFELCWFSCKFNHNLQAAVHHRFSCMPMFLLSFCNLKMIEQKYNSEKSLAAASDPKFKKYVEWLKANGCIFDKVDFPAYFGQVCGGRAAEDILPQEAIAFVPNKLIISVH